jgi:hypothetical protein
MKKLSIILLALALALVMSVPAMAIHIGEDDSPEGSLGISGKYQFDGEARDVDGTKSDFYDDDFDLTLVMIKGPVKGYVNLEIADSNPWEGTDNSEVGPSPPNNGNNRSQIVDNYYVEWSAMDNLKVKIGEYGLSFGRNIGTDSAGARNIQLTYMLDAVDISAAMMRENDGTNDGAEDDDDDTLYIMLSAKEAGPFTTLDVVNYNQTNDATGGSEDSYTGVDLALPIGPVGLGFEYGANGGDLDGDFMLVEIGLEELVGFDVNVNYFASSDDYSAYDGNDFAPAMILGDQVNGDLEDITVIWVDASYKVNDNLTVSGQAVVSAEDDAGDAYGNEFDVGLKYQIADNVTYKAAYGTYSEGDFGSGGDVDRTELFHRLEFTF